MAWPDPSTVKPACPTEGGIAVRSADAGDWSGIWDIMRVVAGSGDTFTYPVDLAESDGRSLWMASGGEAIVAVDDRGMILGTAKMGANQMGPGGHVATASFMVAPSARGQGVGRRLGEAVIDRATASGFRSMQFNAVVSTNLVAVRLWQSLGFEIVGRVPGAFAHPTEGDVSLYVMHRSLGHGR